MFQVAVCKALAFHVLVLPLVVLNILVSGCSGESSRTVLVLPLVVLNILVSGCSGESSRTAVH